MIFHKQKSSFRWQLFCTMSTFIIISSFLLVAASISLFMYTVKTNYVKAFTKEVRISNSLIDYRLENIVNNTRTLLNNSTFKAILEEGNGDNFEFTITQAMKLDEILRAVAGSNTAIETIFVTNNKGQNNYWTKLSGIGDWLNRYYFEVSTLEAPWKKDAKKNKGLEVFTGENVLYDKANTVSVVKQIIAPETMQPLGYIVIILNNKIFSLDVGRNDDTFGNFLVIERKKSEEGRNILIYSNSDKDLSQDMFDHYIKGNLSGYIFSSYVNEQSEWELVSILPNSVVNRSSQKILIISLIIVFGMLIILIFVATKISKRISRPIEQIENAIQDVGDGLYKVAFDFDDSEVGRLGTKFKDLVNNNLDLHEKLLQSELKERESQLLLLQSQINPHFLYNTLDSLYFMAIINKADDIAEMVNALSKMFKLSLNQGKKLIKVKSELEKLEAYFKIQNFRFNNRFSFIIDVDNALYEEEILSFMLQPIVENAVNHGLEPKLGNGTVKLIGRLVDNDIIFTVKDDGVGIDDFSRLDSGYSMKNIRERIKLYYGLGYKMEVESDEEGTKVTITLGRIEKE